MKIPSDAEIDAVAQIVGVVDLEYKMRAVHAALENCACAPYLMNNHQRLVEELTVASINNKEHPEELVARFVKGVHQRHVDGHTL